MEYPDETCKHDGIKKWFPDHLNHPEMPISCWKEVLVCCLCGMIVQESEKDELELVDNAAHGEYIGMQELLGIIPNQSDPDAIKMMDLTIL